jgi:hypothetical protein
MRVKIRPKTLRWMSDDAAFLLIGLGPEPPTEIPCFPVGNEEHTVSVDLARLRYLNYGNKLGSPEWLADSNKHPRFAFYLYKPEVLKKGYRVVVLVNVGDSIGGIILPKSVTDNTLSLVNTLNSEQLWDFGSILSMRSFENNLGEYS